MTTSSRTSRGAASWFGLVILLAIGAAVFFATRRASAPSGNVSIENPTVKSDSAGHRVVTGVLHNNSQQLFEAVSVEVELLMRDDSTLVGRAMASTSNLRAGDSWTFSAPVPRPDAMRFRIRNVSCRLLADDATPAPGTKQPCELSGPVRFQ